MSGSGAAGSPAASPPPSPGNAQQVQPVAAQVQLPQVGAALQPHLVDHLHDVPKVGPGRKVHHKAVNALLALPCGSLLSAGEDMSVMWIGADAGEPIRLAYSHEADVMCMEWLGGNLVATGDVEGIAAIWDVKTKVRKWWKDFKGSVLAVARLDQGRVAFAVETSGGVNDVQIWRRRQNIVEGHKFVELIYTVSNVAGSPTRAMAVDARRRLYIATGAEMRLRVFDVAGSSTEALFRHSHEEHDNCLTCVSAGRHWAVSADDSGDVAVFSVETEQMKTKSRAMSPGGLHLSAVKAVVVIEHLLISAGIDRQLVFSTLPTCTILCRRKLPHAPTALAILPPNRVAVAYANGLVSVATIPDCCLPLADPNADAMPMWPESATPPSSRARDDYHHRRRLRTRTEPGRFKNGRQVRAVQAASEARKRAASAAPPVRAHAHQPGAPDPSAKSTVPAKPASAAPPVRAHAHQPGAPDPSAKSTVPAKPASAAPPVRAHAHQPGASHPSAKSTVPAKPASAAPPHRKKKDGVSTSQRIIARRRLCDAAPLTTGRVPIVVRTPPGRTTSSTIQRTRFSSRKQFRLHD